MDSKELLGYLSVGCSLVGYGIYLRSIYASKTKPHAFSWGVWTILMWIVFFAQLSKGAGPGCWVTGTSAACCLIITVLALLRGEKNITRSDWGALLLALTIIPVWLLTKDPLAAVMMATVIDALAYYPTFRKSWHKPFEENFLLYVTDVTKWIVAFFALTDYSFTTMLYPSFCFAANIALASMIIGRRWACPLPIAKHETG